MATVTGFRTPEEAALDLELPLLGTWTAGTDDEGPVAAALPADDGKRQAAEWICDRLLEAPLLAEGCVGVLGDVPSSLRAEAASALASALASERTTILIDADLRAGHLSFDDRRRAQEGLVDILRYGVRSPRVVAPTLTPGLALLPVGSRTLDLEGTYGAEAVGGLFAELGRGGEVLFVNGPGYADVDAAEPLLAHVEGWILLHMIGRSDPERTRMLRDRCGRTRCIGILVLQGAAAAEPRGAQDDAAPTVEMRSERELEEAAESARAFAAPVPEETVPVAPPAATGFAAAEVAAEAAAAPGPDRLATPPAPAPAATAPDFRDDLAPEAPAARGKSSRAGWWFAAAALAVVLAVVVLRGRPGGPAGDAATSPGRPAFDEAGSATMPVAPDDASEGDASAPAVAQDARDTQATPPASASPAPTTPEPPAEVARPASTPPPAQDTGAQAATGQNSTGQTAEPPAAPRTAVEPPAASKPSATAAVPANPAPLGDVVYAVHLESVKSEDGATKEAESLARAGLATFVHRTEIPDKGTWWRVYVGPFGSRAEADAAAASLKASGRDYAQVHKLRRDEVE